MSATANTLYNQFQGVLATMKKAVLDGDSYASTILGVYPIEYGDCDEGFYGTVAFTLPFINDLSVELEGDTYGEMVGLRIFRPVPMNENEIKRALCLAMKDQTITKGPLLDAWKILRSEGSEGESTSWVITPRMNPIHHLHGDGSMHCGCNNDDLYLDDVGVVRWIMRNGLWPRGAGLK